jgi:hypothetical protein
MVCLKGQDLKASVRLTCLCVDACTQSITITYTLQPVTVNTNHSKDENIINPTDIGLSQPGFIFAVLNHSIINTNMKPSMMTTQEVARRYCELANQNKWPEILEELCGEELINKEPEHVIAEGYLPPLPAWKI